MWKRNCSALSRGETRGVRVARLTLRLTDSVCPCGRPEMENYLSGLGQLPTGREEAERKPTKTSSIEDEQPIPVSTSTHGDVDADGHWTTTLVGTS